MWLFLNDAFLSIVSPSPHDNTRDLLVRARFEGDIQRVFPSAEVIMTPDGDYRYRTWVDRRTVAAVIAIELDDIGYNNFKSSVDEDWRHDTYLSVWKVMRHMQQQRKDPTNDQRTYRQDQKASRARRPVKRRH